MYSTIARELSSFCFILNIYYENFLKLLCFCLWAPFSTVCFILFYVHYSVLFLVCFLPAQSSSVPIFPILPLMSPQFLLNFVWEFWCACTHVFHPIYDSIFLLDILPKYSNWIHRRNAKRASARAHKAHPMRSAPSCRKCKLWEISRLNFLSDIEKRKRKEPLRHTHTHTPR